MARIAPLRGITYDAAKAGAPVGQLICEPYDKIDEPLRQKFLAMHPKNAVRLILGKKDDPVEDPSLAALEPYPRARALMDRWLEQGVLKRAEKPALYLLEQYYHVDGREKWRFGIIARVAVDGDDVKFHERTFAGPKTDRRSLLDATDADFDQVFFLADDPEGDYRALLERLTNLPGGVIARPETGRGERLVAIDDEKTIEEITTLLSKREVTIADGHHRFEMTRERYLEKKKAGAAVDGDRYRTAAIFAAEDTGLTILPTHRLVKLAAGLTAEKVVEKLGERLEVDTTAAYARPAIENHFSVYGPEKGTVFMYSPALEWGYTLRLKPGTDLAKLLPNAHETTRHLEVTWLHGLALDPIFGEAKHDTGDKIGYVRKAMDGVAKIDAGEYDLIFVLPATQATDVVRCGKAGARMPQKSTDFYPKLMSGWVIEDRREPKKK